MSASRSGDTAFRYEGADGVALAGFRWRGEADTRLILQLAHGAGEYSGRYRERLSPLINAGVVVYAADHRGHGLTAGMSHLGDFGPGGAAACVSDMAVLSRLARSENPGAPLVLMGHSLGAMFAQAYVQEHSELIDGLVLSGSGGPGPRFEGPFNSAFPNARTAYDWLSRDPREVDRYVADPLCGIQFNDGSLADVRALAERTNTLSGLDAVRPGLPVYVFVGEDDPVHNRMRALQPLMDAYTARGLDVRFRLYPGGRHEMLNETNRDEVVSDLLTWLASYERPASNPLAPAT